MLSYQHGFHAGNKADILKHAVLDALLRNGPEIGKPHLYVETHAGRGVYDLTGPQARKTGEAADGVVAMLNRGVSPNPLTTWLDSVRQDGLRSYRGSPGIAARCLSPDDRLVLFERHPAEHKALSENLANDPRIRIQKGDGYREALRLAPRRGEHMTLFIDPSYETLRDMDELADWAPRALARWPEATVILWLPLFKDEREAAFGAYLSDLADGIIVGARWVPDTDKDTALLGSAIVAYRVSPAGAEEAAKIASTLQSYWSQA